LEEM